MTVTGSATLVTDAHVRATYRELPLMAWVPDERDEFVTITTGVMQGQQILPG